MTRIVNNLGWGIAWAMAFAMLLSMFVGVQALLRGSAYFESYGLSLLEVVAIYFGSGLIGGFAAGLLRPLARSRVGATVMGALIGPCVYGAISIAMGDRGGSITLVALAAGIPVGAACGYSFSKPAQSIAEEHASSGET